MDGLTLTKEAAKLIVNQTSDGVWGSAIISAPVAGAKNPGAGIGTATAVHRLLELGWDRESPPIHNARRPLFRLLAEDTDPNYLYEMAGNGREPESIIWSRGILRAAAAAALSHAGYERDPRLRGAATRAVERVDEYISSPVAEDPWTKVAGAHVLVPEAAPPSLHFLIMLAFMPEFRNERDDFVDRLMAYLSRPASKHAPNQVVAGKVVLNPYLVLGDPLGSRAGVDGDVSFAMFWLELMARLTMLQRFEGWRRQYERFLDDRDRDLVWRPGKNQAGLTSNPVAWPFADLQGRGAEGLSAEVTFRLGLIATLVGRPLEYGF